MKYLYGVSRHLLITFFALPFILTGCNAVDAGQLNSNTGADADEQVLIDNNDLVQILSTLPVDELSTAESDGLLFMREEEKLAHDVYINLFDKWGARVFSNIAVSEQSHTDAILTLLERYNIADPVGTNAEGVFVDGYLQDLYDNLVAQGSASLIDALLVGAAIEEIDLIDIQKLVDELEGNADIALVYENLMEGSRNHLRAFVRNLEKQGVTYQPQYLSQDVYDAIINAGS